MSGREKRAKRRKADDRRFVEVARQPSIGVETSTGRPWVGVDQQVGHGSADALFALTDAQYTAALADGAVEQGFEGECWRGDHDDLLLFHPGGGSWRPERWHPLRTRMLPPRFAGELWWHVDALGDASDGEHLAVSRALAAGTARVSAGPEGVSSMTFRLVGDDAYPRAGALIAGLDAGSDRGRARAILGDPVDAAADLHAVEGDLVRLDYVDGGLAGIVLERPAPRPLPGGDIRVFLEALGAPEQGEAFRAAARLAGGASRRWAFSSGAGRRLVAFDGGVEMQVEDARVLSARILLPAPASGTGTGDAYRHADALLPDTTWPPSRADVHRALGEPAASNGSVDLHRFGERDLLVEYGPGADADAGTPRELTAVPHGVSVSHRIHRWRSGEFALFLDVLGREESHPLVEHVRGLAGVRLRMRNGRVAEVEIGSSGYQSERFAAFVDGMPAEPTRENLPFGRPALVGEHDDVHEFEQGPIRVRSADGTRITTITVGGVPPRDPSPRR